MRWKKTALLVFSVVGFLRGQKPNVLFVRLAFSIEAVSFIKLAENGPAKGWFQSPFSDCWWMAPLGHLPGL